MEYDDFSDWGDLENLTDFYEDYEYDYPRKHLCEHNEEEFYTLPVTPYELSSLYL